MRDVIRHELNQTQAQGKILVRLSQADVPADARDLLFSAPFAQHWGAMFDGARVTAAQAAVDGAIVLTRDLQVLGFGAKIAAEGSRSEERRVGKECRSRWSPYH